ncbi:MAG: Cyclohexadienyl dehydrogenase [Gemmatimonadaceae bacterium]|nr:Cyclohexadienyl dehydrogenase [Gemmatimonadaceae bacterium]
MRETPSPIPQVVAIVGLGLIGGSIARDLVHRGIRVVAYDRDVEALRRARISGIVSGTMDAGMREVALADVVVVATPVDAAHGVLRMIAGLGVRAGVVMDVGGTKCGVVATATDCGLGEVFVGSHPLAGDHQSGWQASRAGLLDGRRVFVCPTPHTTRSAAERACAFWRMLGAKPEYIEADRHDRQIAWSSHLPQVVSVALGMALKRAAIPRADLGPGGRDVTRLAGSSPGMWTPVLLENAVAVANGLRLAEGELRRTRELLEAADVAGLAAHLCEVREWFDVAECASPDAPTGAPATVSNSGKRPV